MRTAKGRKNNKHMKKTEQKTKQAYVRPAVWQYAIDADSELLAQSPNVQPGGGGGGHISIVPPTEDNDDDEITGAKKFDLWEE